MPRNLIGDNSRNNNVEPCEINADRVASETGVTCSLDFGGAGATAPGLTSSSTLTYGVTTDKADEDNALKKYRDTIDCDGDPVQINEITPGTTDTWRLAGFSDVVLTMGSDEYKLKFDATSDTPVLANQADVLPLYVGNQDLVISGTIAVENLLLSLKYDTIPTRPANKCRTRHTSDIFHIFCHTAAPPRGRHIRSAARGTRPGAVPAARRRALPHVGRPPCGRI